ncbi:MAG: hypothetical protein ACWIPH_10455, partial [Ostreibacterium sp.]
STTTTTTTNNKNNNNNNNTNNHNYKEGIMRISIFFKLLNAHYIYSNLNRIEAALEKPKERKKKKNSLCSKHTKKENSSY